MIVFVGFMGAGKTTVGRMVAARLGLPFTDTDRAIEQRHGPIPEIFAQKGEAGFRELEAGTIAECLAGPDGVLAVGGGAVGTPSVRRALAGHEVVWLRVGLEDALVRVGHDPHRPMLASPDLGKLFDERQGWYAEVATRILDVDHDPPHLVVDRYFGADPRHSGNHR